MDDAGVMQRLRLTWPGTQLAGPSRLEARLDFGRFFIRIDADGTPARIHLNADQCRDLAAFLVSVADDVESKEQKS